MPLTIAQLSDVAHPAIIQASYVRNVSGFFALGIGEVGKLIEVHQLLFSTSISTGYVAFSETNGLEYVTLQAGNTTVFYSDFADKPLLFPTSGEDAAIFASAGSVRMNITVWYRLIDAP